MTRRYRGPSRPLPDRKISETLLDYALPLLEQLEASAPPAAVERALELAVMVWNADVLEQTTDADHYLAEIRETIRLSGMTPALATVDALIERRRRLFSDDLRLIGNFTVSTDGDGLRLRAEARSNDPAHAPR